MPAIDKLFRIQKLSLSKVQKTDTTNHQSGNLKV